MKKILFISFSCCILFSLIAKAQRIETLLEKNWKFTKGEVAEAMKPEFDDRKRETVTVPHDWAIFGPFERSNDLQEVAVTQNFEKKASVKTGRTGGLPYVGIGWYRTTFDVPADQTGCGMMVGSPYQTEENLAQDLLYIGEFRPEMVGIGPFIPHHDTKFAEEPAGSVDLTLFLLSVIRIMLPQVLLPATTALGTLDPRGREKGFQAGANVVMPNLSPVKNRKQYELYDNKICTGEEAAECRGCLSRRVESVGYEIVTDRGDSPMMLH